MWAAADHCIPIGLKCTYLAGSVHWYCRAVLIYVDKIMSVGEVRAIILNQSYYFQNFHLIDYNMLVFTVIILARRLIAAIVKEVRIVLLALAFYP